MAALPLFYSHVYKDTAYWTEVAQHWAYHAKEDYTGDTGDGAIMWGDGANVIGLVRNWLD